MKVQVRVIYDFDTKKKKKILNVLKKKTKIDDMTLFLLKNSFVSAKADVNVRYLIFYYYLYMVYQ